MNRNIVRLGMMSLLVLTATGLPQALSENKSSYGTIGLAETYNPRPSTGSPYSPDSMAIAPVDKPRADAGSPYGLVMPFSTQEQNPRSSAPRILGSVTVIPVEKLRPATTVANDVDPLAADVPARVVIGTPGAPSAPIAAASSISISDYQVASDIYSMGTFEFQALSGVAYHAYIGNIRTTGARMLFLPQTLRAGVALNDPDPAKVFGGTWSVIAESDTLPIVYGPGHILVGGSLGLRYTLSQRCSRLIPYTQLSFGGSYSDSFRTLDNAIPPGGPPGRTPTGLTSGAEFLMTSVTGVHYLLSPRWSFDLEGSTTLISNFGIAPNHRTLYPMGVAVGFTRIFR